MLLCVRRFGATPVQAAVAAVIGGQIIVCGGPDSDHLQPLTCVAVTWGFRFMSESSRF